MPAFFFVSGNSGRKDGFALFVLVVLLAALSAMTILVQTTRTSSQHEQAVGVLADRNATGTAQAALDEAFRQLCTAASDPSDPRFPELRRRLAGSAAQVVDLADLVHLGDVAATLKWKREKAPATTSLGKLALKSFRCVAQKVSPLGDFRIEGAAQPTYSASPDERGGLICLQAAAEVKLAGKTVRREITETRELRVVVAGPPRPFDQIGFYARDLSYLTHAGRANQLRRKLLDELADIKAKFSQLPSGVTAEFQKKLQAIYNGLPAQEKAEAKVLPLPEGPVAVTGFGIPGPHDLAGLNLAARLEEDLVQIHEARANLDSAAQRAASDGGAQLVAQATQTVQAFNRAIQRMWGYQRDFRMFPRTAPEFYRALGAYEERLHPAWFQQRTAINLDPKSALYADWRAGRRSLSGVFQLKSAQPLVLGGPLSGRAVVVVEAPELKLENLMPSGGERELVTVVVESGRVRLSGEVHAVLIATGSAQVEIEPGCQMQGSLLLGTDAAPSRLAGQLRPEWCTAAGLTLGEALNAPGRGAYAVGISPAPLWRKGDRQ